MKRRSPAAPLLLPVVTIGIYSLVWYVKVKNEMNLTIATRIPSAWLLIVPIGNLFWLIAFARGARDFTSTGTTVGTFFLLGLLGPIGAAILQARLNRAISGVVAPTAAFVPAVA